MRTWTADDEILAVTEDLYFTCPEDPARLSGAPIGQYHCPHCGCMVVAGLRVHLHQYGCWLGLEEL